VPKPALTSATNPDCGFSSFLAAAVYSDPAWITSMVEASGDHSDTSSAQVDLFSYQSYAPGEYTISHSETDRNSDIDPATGVWSVSMPNLSALLLISGGREHTIMRRSRAG